MALFLIGVVLCSCFSACSKPHKPEPSERKVVFEPSGLSVESESVSSNSLDVLSVGDKISCTAKFENNPAATYDLGDFRIRGAKLPDFDVDGFVVLKCKNDVNLDEYSSGSSIFIDGVVETPNDEVRDLYPFETVSYVIRVDSVSTGSKGSKVNDVEVFDKSYVEYNATGNISQSLDIDCDLKLSSINNGVISGILGRWLLITCENNSEYDVEIQSVDIKKDGLSYPVDYFVDNDGRLYVADYFVGSDCASYSVASTYAFLGDMPLFSSGCVFTVHVQGCYTHSSAENEVPFVLDYLCEMN